MKRRYVVLSLAAVLALALAVPAFGGPTNIVSALTNVKKTANKALKTAKAAGVAAAAAQSTANTAQSDADAAATAAKKAQTTASEGVTAAKNAQTTANSATTAASAAKNAADAAQASANAAKAAADQAQATANSKFGQTFTEFSSASPSSKIEGLKIAECPAGSALTGGGYHMTGAGANEAVPLWNGPYGTAWLTEMEGIGGESTNAWSVVALAQCAKP